MLKAQVNILELEKPSNQVAELSILKRAMTEHERVQKQFELKVSHMNDLITKEMDKSKLLENQLADNLKRVRMLTTGTTTLDHLLTIGSSKEKEIQVSTKVQTDNQKNGNLKKTTTTQRGNGCHFCGSVFITSDSATSGKISINEPGE
ncbi:hypothetical protein DY000_02033407 [Brassica cretica]|uniref:Uncharacterized protein n=1 Tax=Brassica cretica TaxID=69181 RepID=A0ABQ7DLM0_BRACR|nr:hypothetical protein DY000_02033407 [Brassica cretica]